VLTVKAQPPQTYWKLYIALNFKKHTENYKTECISYTWSEKLQ